MSDVHTSESVVSPNPRVPGAYSKLLYTTGPVHWVDGVWKELLHQYVPGV
jgi:hypothetical protein